MCYGPKPLCSLASETTFSILQSVVAVQLLSRVRLFATPWTAACQASLSFTISWSLLRLMSVESLMLSNHLILCHPLLLLQCNPPQTWSSFLFSLSQSHLLQEVFFDSFYLLPHVKLVLYHFHLLKRFSFQHIFKMKFLCIFSLSWASQVAQMVKCLPARRETQVQSLRQEDSLEKGMATHSSIHSCLDNSMDRGTW